MAPPASCRSEESPLTGRRVAGRDVHGAEHAEREGDPADDLTARPGRCSRGRACCASRSRPASAAPASRPCRPSRRRRCGSPSIRPPGSCHQTAAATTTASPNRNSPTPSRRCSGSRSWAVRPILRATAPTAWAMPSQIAAIPRPSAANSRTDRTAPRADCSGRRAPCARCWTVRGRFFVVLRDREMRRAACSWLLLREPGGEDVRVAMVTNLGHRHSSHTDHTPHAVAVSARQVGATAARAVRGRTAPARDGRSPR